MEVIKYQGEYWAVERLKLPQKVDQLEGSIKGRQKRVVRVSYMGREVFTAVLQMASQYCLVLLLYEQS